MRSNGALLPNKVDKKNLYAHRKMTIDSGSQNFQKNFKLWRYGKKSILDLKNCPYNRFRTWDTFCTRQDHCDLIFIRAVPKAQKGIPPLATWKPKKQSPEHTWPQSWKVEFPYIFFRDPHYIRSCHNGPGHHRHGSNFSKKCVYTKLDVKHWFWLTK